MRLYTVIIATDSAALTNEILQDLTTAASEINSDKSEIVISGGNIIRVHKCSLNQPSPNETNICFIEQTENKGYRFSAPVTINNRYIAVYRPL